MKYWIVDFRALYYYTTYPMFLSVFKYGSLNILFFFGFQKVSIKRVYEVKS